NDDGTMSRLPELTLFAERHNLPLVTIEDLVAYLDRQAERDIREVA
ncbi:3,4-dihydroxy-2-butanone-4-phosphate synthase, partial [Rhizobium leguminosarum]